MLLSPALTTCTGITFSARPKSNNRLFAQMKKNDDYVLPDASNIEAVKNDSPSPDEKMKEPQTLAQIITAQFEALQKYQADALEPDADEVEAIHKLRVTTRRLQALLDLLRIGKDEAGVGKVKKKLRNLRRKLSEVRNYDVFLSMLEQEAANRRSLQNPFEALTKELHHRRAKLASKIHKPIQAVDAYQIAKSLGLHLNGQDAQTRKAEKHKQYQNPSFAGIADDKAILQHTAERLEQRLEEFLILAVQALPTTHPEELHQLRIAAKRLRYLLESASEMGFDSTATVLNWLCTLQDKIGDWHDLEAIENEIIGIVGNRKFIQKNLLEASSILAAAVHLQKKKRALVKRLFPVKVHKNLDSASKRVAKALRQASQ
jgi:CHAD domain-containing protein